MKDEPNRITAILKVVITGEFYDDEASEETLRYCTEQDLEDAGFDVDVSLLKEQEAVVPEVYCIGRDNYKFYRCPVCKTAWCFKGKYCLECGRKVKWDDHPTNDGTT